MTSRIGWKWWLAWTLLVCGARGLFAQEPPTFGDGDLGELKCQVTKDSVEKVFRRLDVEVRNSGKLAAEPLVFRVVQVFKKKPEPYEESVPRVRFPFAARHGRPVPPGGKATYSLQVNSLDEPVRIEVRVERACWYQGDAVPKPALTIGPLESAQQPSFAGDQVPITRVRITNPLPFVLDAIFVATYSQPQDVKGLVAVRLPASAEHEWLLTEFQSKLDFGYDAPFAPVRVTKLELVDWCLVESESPDAIGSVFRPAYENWLRWSEPFPGLRGRFAYDFRATKVQQQAVGRFRIDPAGDVAIELDPDPAGKRTKEVEAEITKDASSAVVDAFADLRRLDFEKVAQKNRLTRVASDAFEIDGPGYREKARDNWDISAGDEDSRYVLNVSVRDGRVAGGGDRNDLDYELWRTESLDGGYVVTRRANRTNQWVQSFRYGHSGSVVVPLSYQERFGLPSGVALRETTLELSAIESDGGDVAIPSRPVTGPGADALRAAWQSGYRYPDTPKKLRVKFQLKTPGTDWMWHGQKDVSGELVMEQYRGFRMDNSGWTRIAVDPSTSMAEDLRRSFSLAFTDRMLMWCGRDFNGRGEFDTVFAGATIGAPGTNGTFRIEGSFYTGVTIGDGRVVSVQTKDGSIDRYTWTKLGARMVVTRMQSGGEDLRGKFSGDGELLVPTEIEFRTVFGPDWGPEIIQFKNPRLE